MLDDTPISVTLTASQLGHALGAVRFRRKKREREMAKSDFVPEPGRVDTNEVKVARLREAEDLMQEALDEHLGVTMRVTKLSDDRETGPSAEAMKAAWRTVWRQGELARAFDAFAAQVVQRAIAALTCESCGGLYPNEDCGNRKNAIYLQKPIPCRPGQP
jgi:hypothetical protein